jgi:hypothetical protein
MTSDQLRNEALVLRQEAEREAVRANRELVGMMAYLPALEAAQSQDEVRAQVRRLHIALHTAMHRNRQHRRMLGELCHRMEG